MNGREFARKRARIEHEARTPSAQRKALRHLVSEARAVEVIVQGKLVGYQLPDGFMVCVKRRYHSEVEAMMELSNVQLFQRINSNRHIPIRAYFCAYCRGWHLTSRKSLHASEAA